MRKVFKYGVLEGGSTCEGEVRIPMPQNARIVHVNIDGGGYLCLWAEVNPLNALEARRFTVAGTGWNVPEFGQYVGTAVTPAGFVWHVYELPTQGS